ncbi:MAG: DUF480 domain-containing protein [Pseudomonadales bacterium]|nr:DUF480 domain-containing protein [Pseudomonadales bacterium]
MNIELTPEEVRVIGCLMEKAVTTPDQYPLTLNALTSACNQKSSRDPVMNLGQGAVQRTVRQLESRYLVATREGARNGVEKYTQRLCNTQLATLRLDPAQYAIVTLLLLRGPQTPGELRTRSDRLHKFADNAEVTATLAALIEREEGPVVARLPRKPGRQDHEYMHLFAGEVDSVEEDLATRASSSAPREDRVAALERRLEKLEQAVASLAEKLGEPVDLGHDD